MIVEKIEKLIEPTLQSLGYDVVRIKLSDGSPQILQIMAERRSDGDLGIEDCSKISRAISTILDIEDPISSEYNLEVSSPGIDRPLVKLNDFRRFAGNEIKLTTNYPNPLDNRRRYRGLLVGLTNDDKEIVIELNDASEDAIIEYENVASAKLVLTDELIAKAQIK